MRDPIERLLWEHQGIMRQVADLRGAVRALAERGEQALPEVRPVLQATVRMIEIELLAHARREDDALFPALERALSEASLTGEMRREHRDIHAEADRFRATLRQLNEVEHPAIVAGGARLGALAEAGEPEALRGTGAALIRLLDEHFQKEEEILFPMAREVLDPSQLEAVSRAMDALDAG
jgi:regulator of cell morphogenesis and NO signaling